MRVELLAELKKRNNDETVRKMMDMTSHTEGTRLSMIPL